MKFRKGTAALMLAGAALLTTPLAMVAAKNWNVQYSVNANGHAVGNPDAPVKLISFVSYTCSHCANFEMQADGPLRVAYIHEGKVEHELRHTIRNPIDLAAALITECGPQEKFFDNHRRIILAQSSWLGKADSASNAQKQRWSSGQFGSRMRAIAADLDFYELMKTRGYSRSELDRCLTDTARAEAISNASEASSAQFGVQGTPSFAINGALLEGVHNWSALQASIDAVLSAGE